MVLFGKNEPGIFNVCPKNEIRCSCPMESLAWRTAENHLADWQRGAIKTGWENHGKSMM